MKTTCELSLQPGRKCWWESYRGEREGGRGLWRHANARRADMVRQRRCMRGGGAGRVGWCFGYAWMVSGCVGVG